MFRWVCAKQASIFQNHRNNSFLGGIGTPCPRCPSHAQAYAPRSGSQGGGFDDCERDSNNDVDDNDDDEGNYDENADGESSWFEFDDGHGEDVSEAEGKVDDQNKSGWSLSRRLPCYVDSQGRKKVEALLGQVNVISP